MSTWSSIVGMPSQFEVPWGWEVWNHLSLVNILSHFEVPWGGTHDIIWLCGHPKVNLKFHGDGKFDIILPLWTWQINLESHRPERLSSCTCGHAKPIWNPTGGRNFDIVLPCEHAKPNWSSIVVVFFHIMLPVWTCQDSLVSSYTCGRPVPILNSMKVGMLVSYYLCGHSMSTWSSTGVF